MTTERNTIPAWVLGDHPMFHTLKGAIRATPRHRMTAVERSQRQIHLAIERHFHGKMPGAFCSPCASDPHNVTITLDYDDNGAPSFVHCWHC